MADTTTPDTPEGFVRVVHDSLKDADGKPAASLVPEDTADHWATLGWKPAKSTTVKAG